MHQLNYHHLLYFRVIATEGSISKAALKLRLGQPTLSMQLKQFEDVLGHQLFERKNRTLVLTEMGRVVLSYANEIYQLGEEMMETLQGRPAGQSRVHLHVGALDSVPRSLVRSLMRKAFACEPCQVSILEGKGSELMTDLIEHRLDLVLSNTSPPSLTDERLFSRSLSKMPLIVCGSANFQSLKDSFPLSLNGAPFILPTGHSRVRHDFERFLEERDLKIDVVAEAQDTSLMKTLAVEGHGLIVASEIAVQELLRPGDLRVIGSLGDYYEEIWLIAAQRKIQNPVAQRLMKEFEFEL